MDCTACGYKWCWVCGCNRESMFHYFLAVPCQFSNLALILGVPTVVKVLLIPFLLILGVPLFLLFFFNWGMYYFLFEECHSCSKCLYGILDQCCGCFCTVLGFCLYTLPLFIILISIVTALSFASLAIMIGPCYLFSLISLMKMIVWWCQNRNI